MAKPETKDHLIDTLDSIKISVEELAKKVDGKLTYTQEESSDLLEALHEVSHAIETTTTFVDTEL